MTPPARRQAPQSAPDRLSRLLSMVPYLLERPGIPVPEAAAHFGLSESELVADLQLIFLCGLPGGMPDDLIEAEWEGGQVFVGNADAIARPLRLGLDEAVALLVGLRTLAETPGAGDTEALDGALAKLVEATGEAREAADVVEVVLDDEVDADLLARVRRAVDGHRRLHLRYHSPGRDEATERDVDPMRLLSLEGHIYLEGWCHRAEAVRLFRLGRVLEADVLDVDGTPPPQARTRDLDDAVFQPSPDDLLVTLDLAPSARWVADFYSAEQVEDRGGRTRAVVRVGDASWVVRLALGSGGAVVVVDPPELVDRVADAARDAVSRYDEDA